MKSEEQPRRWLLVVFIILAIVISVVLINKIVMDKKAAAGKTDDNGIFDIFKDTNSKISQNSFNSKFEMYQGTEYGSSVSRLLDEIITNNKKNKDMQVKVVYEDIQTIDPIEIKNLKKEFDTWDKLEVSIDYDEDGYANIITIEPYEIKQEQASDDKIVINNGDSVVSTTSEFDKNRFNSLATFHAGNKSGFFVKSMIDYVISNNSSETNHQLYVKYKDESTSDANSLNSLKSKFGDFTEYEVVVSYDEDGFANGFNVK